MTTEGQSHGAEVTRAQEPSSAPTVQSQLPAWVGVFNVLLFLLATLTMGWVGLTYMFRRTYARGMTMREPPLTEQEMYQWAVKGMERLASDLAIPAVILYAIIVLFVVSMVVEQRMRSKSKRRV